MSNFVVNLEFADKSVYTETVENLTVSLANAALYKDKEGITEKNSPLGNSIYFLYQLMEKLGEEEAVCVLAKAKSSIK